ncbi:hypothetical protein N7516_001823 [Penicillium verrucosum]|uniref:uncharacterized protein n=1 Tax=Penicillium verrucosum TaxID=60171 RepID=UPI002544FECA|nr:uncharacterized protein N7516_001823 [Penicillium verrucosum]KAJ5941655.1 hypothetical protein N7516_001823 [Penicillium verrucosum]
MSTPRSILIIGANAIQPSQSYLQESRIIAKEPGEAERIEKFRKLGNTFTSSDLTLDFEEKLAPIFKEFDVVICCTGYMT